MTRIDEAERAFVESVREGRSMPSGPAACVHALAILKIVLLAATLAFMHRAWHSLFSGSRARGRSHVVVLGLALCLWLVVSATHIHAGDELATNEPSNACSFCLSLPSGGTPLTHPLLTPPQFVATEVVVETVTALVAIDVPSSYLSRGPPAV